MKKRKIIIRIIILMLSVLILAGGTAAFYIYNAVFKPNVRTADTDTFLYIHTGATFNDVKDSLYANEYIINSGTFERIANLKGYDNHVKPGRYKLKNGMSNNDIINMLRSGKQSPVKLTFNNIRTKEQFAGRISKQIEADSVSIISLLYNSPFLEKYAFSPENIISMFLPDTYEFFWNTDAETFIERMHKEYMKFWTDERTDKAASIGLTITDVSVLASIVQSETTKKDEMARVAGVYINRLNRGMFLQADPTVVFAWGDFTLKRVLHRHLEIDSPYNTYKYPGLPPGPITMPEKHTIEKVLDYEKHNYMFFCAKEDLSGYHAFAVSHNEHINNAKRYQQALNRLNIR